MLFCCLLNVKYLTWYWYLQLRDFRYLPEAKLNNEIKFTRLTWSHSICLWTELVIYTTSTIIPKPAPHEMWLPTCVWRQISLVQERRIGLGHSCHTCQFTVPVCVKCAELSACQPCVILPCGPPHTYQRTIIHKHNTLIEKQALNSGWPGTAYQS